MMTHRPLFVRMAPAAALLATAGLAATTLAADLDPSGQAGQYEALVATTLVKGAGSPSFAPSTIWAPFLLLGDDAIMNATLVENVNGNPVGYTATFAGDPARISDPAVVIPPGDPPLVHRTVTSLGTTDAADGGVSNNVIVSELDNRGNSPGALLPDGTITFLERFFANADSGQNNIGFAVISGALPQTAEPISTGQHVISPSASNVGNAGETAINPDVPGIVRGAVFIGTTSSVRDPSRSPVNNANLLTGHTSFNFFPGLVAPEVAASVVGVNVYAGLNNDPRSGCPAPDPNASIGCPGAAHIAAWNQGSVPLPTNPPGETRADTRQTQPVLTLVTTPSGAQVVYVAHMIGYTGGTPYTGSSFNPLMLAVDTLRMDYASGDPIPENNTILIEADALGGEGTQHGAPFGIGAGFADYSTTDPLLRFVDHGATGGAAEVSTVSQYDMNANGYVAAILGDRTVQPTLYSVRLYKPTWNGAGDRITGYLLEKIVTFNGDLDNNNNPIIPAGILDTSPSPDFAEASVIPFSGVALDDNNRVAFSAITDAAQQVGDFDANPFTPDTTVLLGQTTTLFVYDLVTDSLHSIIKGGQSGTIISDGFLGNGADEDLMVGHFGFSQSTDTFSRDSFSRDGSLLGISFRSSNNVFTVGGTVETEFDTLPNGTTPEGFTDRGGLLFAPGSLGLDERNVRGSLIIKLGAFDNGVPVCCLGDADGDGIVKFSDITSVLSNWLSNGANGGDADCDGVVKFADITSVLSNWLSVCP